jgi:hypothetical protein
VTYDFLNAFGDVGGLNEFIRLIVASFLVGFSTMKE